MNLKRVVRKMLHGFLTPIEVTLLADHYFSLQQCLNYQDRILLLIKSLLWRITSPPAGQAEISFVLYSKACERMLMPLILYLLENPDIQSKNIRVNVIVVNGIHQLKLSSNYLEKLHILGCPVQNDYYSLIRAISQPQYKLVMICLDHRLQTKHHKWGVETADTLHQHGVKTVSIQHGGTRADSVQFLASSASDVILVWGDRVFRDLVRHYHLDPQRLRIVGNPLHDRLLSLNADKTRQNLIDAYPNFQEDFARKKLVLVAACLHTEYKGLGDEPQVYQDYIRHIYNSIDCSKVLLLVKMHPLDTLHPNLYLEALETILNPKVRESVIVLDPGRVEFDVYSLLQVCDLLITRASTVAEEALLMGKAVIAFDLFTEGTSKSYKHLEDYDGYITVYAEPESKLQTTMEQILATDPSNANLNQAHLEAELTHRLDGRSTLRAVKELLKQLESTVSPSEPK